MKILLILLIFGLSNTILFSQTDRVDSLIQNINNEQLKGTCNYVWRLVMNSPAGDSLIKIGKSATAKLTPWLDDAGKGIIVHHILSNIWIDTIYSSNSFEYFDAEGIVEYSDCGLLFYEKSGRTCAKQELLEENKKKWINGLQSYKESNSFKIASLFPELLIVDRSENNFQKKRTFQNKSKGILYSEFDGLLGAKYGSPNICKVFGRLAENYKISSLIDCFYVNFEDNGLEIRFDKDSILTSLFFLPEWQGELMNGIKLTDSTNNIITKIGSPDSVKHDSSIGAFWYYYKYNLLINLLSYSWNRDAYEVKYIKISK